MPSKSIRQAINEALRQEMRRDPRIIVIGDFSSASRGSLCTMSFPLNHSN